MKPTGNDFAWDSQETAERIANKRRMAHVALLDELEELNKTLDSLKLYELIVNQREKLREFE